MNEKQTSQEMNDKTSSQELLELIKEGILKHAGNIANVKMLAEAGAPLDDEDKYGNNILFQKNISPEVVRYVIAKGIDVNHRNNNKETRCFISAKILK